MIGFGMRRRVVALGLATVFGLTLTSVDAAVPRVLSQKFEARSWKLADQRFAAALPQRTTGTPAVQIATGIQLLKKSTNKLSSRLALLAQSGTSTGTAAAASLLSLPADGPGSLLQTSSGELLVSIRLSSTDDSTLAALRASGARIAHVSPEYNVVTAYVAQDKLAAVNAISAVQNVREELQPTVAGAERHASGTARPRAVVQAGCAPIISEGDAQLRAADARAALPVSGAGVTVGILSDSFARVTTPTSADQDIASGDLPGPSNPCGKLTPTTVIDELNADIEGPSDEGRAMTQIVHDLAPDAHLAFATAFEGLFAFADSIKKLRNEVGANVIVDDISYFNEPYYQDGPVTLAVNQVTAQGALYFSSAGNSNATDKDGNLVSSYEAPAYRPTPCPTLIGQSGPTNTYANDCHSFNPAGGDPTQGIGLASGGSIKMTLQWAQPWFGVTTDIDLILVTSSGEVLAASGDTNSGAQGTQQPFETLKYANQTGSSQAVFVIIARVDGTALPRLKYVLNRSAGIIVTEYDATNDNADTFGPTIEGHNGARSLISTAAIPFDDADSPEDFSSNGPVTLLFGPTVGTTPAVALAAPVVVDKPDVAATDGTQNTFFPQLGDDGAYRFYGTSAAAPHGAAVAALLQQRTTQLNLALNQSQIEQLLESTAANLPNGAPLVSGAGRIDALAVLNAASTLPPIRKNFLPLLRR